MKKPIKIAPKTIAGQMSESENRAHNDTRDKVEQALKSVNGLAYEHSYTDYSEIRGVVQDVENKLQAWGIPKNAWKGVVISSTSGKKVSNAYAKKGSQRAATHVRIERRASGWFLTDIEKTYIWQQGGYVDLILTPEQDRLAVERLRSKYVVFHREDNQ